MKRLLLYFLVSVVDAPMIIGGSIIGAAVSRIGLFIGALLGGIAGVIVAVMVAARVGLIAPEAHRTTTVGGVMGFLLAAAIAVQDWPSAVVPALSGLLVGIGAVLGSSVKSKS